MLLTQIGRERLDELIRGEGLIPRRLNTNTIPVQTNHANIIMDFSIPTVTNSDLIALYIHFLKIIMKLRYL